MSRPVSRGYIEISPDCIELSPWRIVPLVNDHSVDEVMMENPQMVENWHYATDLQVERVLTVDIERLRSSSQLNPQDLINCVLTWTATSTGLQGGSLPVVLVSGRNLLRLSVPGGEIGGTLRLRTIVSAVIGVPGARHPLAATRSGSILWSDEFQTVLEGSASRFPTEALSFKDYGQEPRDCAWRLDIDTSDIEAPALSAVRIVFNTDHPAYRRLAGAQGDVEAVLTRQFLAYDVARQLVTAALAQPEFKAVDYERGSIGNILRARLATYFGQEGDDVEPLRQRWTSAPSEIDAELQPFFMGDKHDGPFVLSSATA